VHSADLIGAFSTPCLQISGLEEGVNEEGLRYLFSSVVPLLDLRVVRDKFTGAQTC
jgi:RNA recognition motif-containing protein